MSRRDRTRHPAVRDWHLWAEVKRTVVPLRPEPQDFALRPEPRDFETEPLPIPEPTPKPAIRRAGPGRVLPPAYTPPPQRAEQPAPVIEPRMRRRLRRGQIAIDGTIDLHGMRQVEAREALRRFIKARIARGDRTILVITGKGLRKTEEMRILDRGVLRAMLPIWLNEPELAPFVAGWDSAAQDHGGEGAFYVRLKRAAK